jgi:radical SAM superfamily enzyme YgiQ (UPF0313 family)
MHVVFINMPLRETAIPNTPPLGPALLASRLIEIGVKTTIIDLNAYRIKDKLAKERSLRNGRHLTVGETQNLITNHSKKHGEPDIVAFSGMITTLKWQKDVAKIVREIFPDIFLMSGGGLSTEIGAHLFDWIPELNAVVIGEGDNVVIKIVDYVSKNDISKKRLVYRGSSPNNLDSLPLPAWDLLKEDVNGFKIFDAYLSMPVWGGSSTGNSSAAPFTMKRSATTVSSRGCPFSCKFCYRGTQGQKSYRWRSAEHLLRETKWLIEKYNVDFIGFNDDNFIVDKKRLTKLISLFKGLGIRWGTHGRLDSAADIEKLKAIKEAGCVYIGFGGESAHPDVLKNMGKGGFILSKGNVKINGCEFPKTMVEGIKNTKLLGIHGNCTWIMGYPGETLEQLKRTVSFIKWQEELYTEGLQTGTVEHGIATNSVNKNMFIATAYPGTEMFRHPIVRNRLTENFRIQFNPQTHEPIHDENLHQYVLELDDATKIMKGFSDQPLNFSAMPDDVFSKAKEYVETGQIFKILDL